MVMFTEYWSGDIRGMCVGFLGVYGRQLPRSRWSWFEDSASFGLGAGVQDSKSDWPQIRGFSQGGNLPSAHALAGTQWPHRSFVSDLLSSLGLP